MIRYFAVAALLVIGAGNAQPGEQSKLAVRLQAIDTRVLAEEGDEPAREMLERDVRARRREGNDRSSREWRSITSRAEWDKFRAARIETLRRSLGSLPEPGRDVKTRVTRTIDAEGYQIQCLIFESRPGLWVTANLYLPRPLGKAMPGILLCHSHHHPKTEGELQDMGVMWARRGCAVLVMDQLGHGERRQHPFRTAADYPERFAAGRQDYWFRYDTALQLYLVGESLMGWMVNDLMRGVDLLVGRPDIDAKKIVLLGSVAGGGDPAAVTAALDERIAAVVPFNFGGPQPETRYPLPADAEESFNYAGSGSWESTRNLRLSVRDGFLPWVIVASVAPRRLVYAHEFSWDRERDPVWRRLETVYRWYDVSGHLAYTQGRGTLRGGAPEDTHCNNIGPVHREGIHVALAKWFGIETPDEKRPRERRSADELRCMTDEVAAEAKPLFAREIASEIVSKRLASSRTQRITLSAGERTSQLRKHLGALLGNVDEPARDGVTARTVGQLRFGTSWPVGVERVKLATERRIAVPLALVLPTGKESGVPAVVAFCQAGKQQWLKERAEPVAEFLRRGVAVCIVDVRGMGETSPGHGRGRTSAAASLAADEWMLGETIVAGQLRDVLATLTYLRKCPEIDSRRIALWGDSLAAPNPSDVGSVTPHNIDVKLKSPEPGAGLLALLAALYDDSIVAVATGGAVHSFQSVFDSPVCRIPPDAIVPGLLTVADIPDLVAALASRPIRLTTTVDAHNRLVSRTQILNAWKSMPGSEALHHADMIASDGALDPTATARWLADKLQIANKKQ